MRPEIDTLTLNRGQPGVTLLVCPLSYATLPSGVSSDLSKCFLKGSSARPPLPRDGVSVAYHGLPACVGVATGYPLEILGVVARLATT